MILHPIIGQLTDCHFSPDALDSTFRWGARTYSTRPAPGPRALDSREAGPSTPLMGNDRRV